MTSSEHGRVSEPFSQPRSHKPLWVLLILTYAATGAAWLFHYDLTTTSTWYSRAAWAAFHFRVLSIHVGLGVLVVTLLLLLLRRWQFVVAAVPLIVFLLAPAPNSLRYSEMSQGRSDVRVMSVNLLDLNTDTTRVIREIRRQNPDVIAFQEYTPRWHTQLRAALGKSYPAYAARTRDDSFGIAAYSNKPFAADPSTADVTLGTSGIPQLRVVIPVKGRSIAVYAVHFMMPLLPSGTTEQRLQVGDLITTLGDESLPYLVAGDFNMTPRTHQFDELVDSGLTPAWSEGDTTRGITWPATGIRWIFPGIIPGLNLDQLLYSDELSVSLIKAGKKTGSDHLPIVVDIKA